MIALKQFIDNIDLSTRRKRSNAIQYAVYLLERIRVAEQTNIDNFHPNFHNSDAYFNAEDSLDYIIDSISGLSDAY
jgi:hypothetical protein